MATIVDVNGNPIQQAVLREQQTAELTYLHREYANHPARGLTPYKLARLLEEAERGHLQAQTELFLDMEERDAHIYSEMSKRKRAVLNVEWTVEPPEKPTAQEKSDAAMVQELICDIPGKEDMILDMLDGIGHGFSMLEIEWQQLGKNWLPKQLHHRPQSWFQVSIYDQNAIHLRDNSPDGAPLLPFGWIQHVHKAKSGYVSRSGLHRVLAWPYLFKHYAVRDLAELLEIYGMPLRLGKYPSGAGDAEKAALLRAVTQLGHAAAGIIPESMSIDFQKPSDGTEVPFEAMYDMMERAQSKAILGGTLTSQADGKTSTNALGEVHNEVRHDIQASDCRQLAPTLSRDIVYPLLVLNGGRVDDPRRRPRVVFHVHEPEDMGALATNVRTLVNIGLPVSQDWAYEKFNIPKPEKGAATLQPERQAGPGTPTDAAAPPAVPAEPAVAANRARLRAALAVLRGIDSAAPFPDQVQLDHAIDQLGADGSMQRQAADLLSQVLVRLQAADSADAALGILAELFPDMDDNELQDALANMLFAADLVGRLTADDGSRV
ncbi:DUF935 domain-containing protein [Ralstonia mannitolilytica]|uniref:DUF935 domain-containing protein n=1 Tax=Ralstonia mannitolilytica TaxID=105219 RepID=UPI000CEDF9DB|nr:DUF935 domain-containing protein [Ralstonia mannitolilytica]